MKLYYSKNILKPFGKKTHKEKNEIENRVVYLGPSRFRFSIVGVTW